MLGGPPHLGRRASELLDGRLSSAEEAEVRGHLASCRECAAAVQAEQAVRDALRRLGVPGPPADLLAGLMAVSIQTPAAPQLADEDVVRPVTSRPRTPVRGRLSTVLVGTVVLVSAGALGVAGVAGLPTPTAPGGGSVPVAVPAPVGRSTTVSQPALVTDRSTVSTDGTGTPASASASGPFVVVPALFRLP